MKIFLVSVRDSKVDAFEPPIPVPHTGAGIRWFSDQIKDKQTAYGRHPEDYSLWHVGEFNHADGLVAGVFPPAKLIDGDTVISVG